MERCSCCGKPLKTDQYWGPKRLCYKCQDKKGVGFVYLNQRFESRQLAK